MIGLDDKEITEAVNSVYPSGTGTYQVNVADKAIAQAQLKKVVGWLEEDCPHDVTPQMPYTRAKRRHCVECWQVLLEEVKEC